MIIVSSRGCEMIVHANNLYLLILFNSKTAILRISYLALTLILTGYGALSDAEGKRQWNSGVFTVTVYFWLP